MFFIVISVYLGELSYASFKRLWKGEPRDEDEEEEELLSH